MELSSFSGAHIGGGLYPRHYGTKQDSMSMRGLHLAVPFSPGRTTVGVQGYLRHTLVAVTITQLFPGV